MTSADGAGESPTLPDEKKHRSSLPRPPSEGVAHLTYLNSLRGIAALFVAIFAHYIVFTSAYQPNGGDEKGVPFYHYLSFLYSNAYLFVDFFFVLSGLIFHHVYYARIAEGAVPSREFFWARFSRLYPMHILTFVLCGLLACSFYARYGQNLIYPCNDAYHAVLNVLFVQKGFFDNCMSFNGPSWSLSIEGFLYLLFFIVARTGRGYLWAFILMSAAVLTLFFRFHWEFLLNPEICRGVFGFFMGFVIYDAMRSRAVFGKTLVMLTIALVAFVGLGYWLRRGGFVLCAASTVFAIVVVLIGNTGPLKRLLEMRPLRDLGDLSLSIYLMHIPIAMTIIFLFRYAKASIPTGDIRFELFYIVLVVSIAILMNRIYETPSKLLLRRFLLSRRRPKPLPDQSAPVPESPSAV